MQLFDISMNKLEELKEIMATLDIQVSSTGSGSATFSQSCWCDGSCTASCAGSCLGGN